MICLTKEDYIKLGAEGFDFFEILTDRFVCTLSKEEYENGKAYPKTNWKAFKYDGKNKSKRQNAPTFNPWGRFSILFFIRNLAFFRN